MLASSRFWLGVLAPSALHSCATSHRETVVLFLCAFTLMALHARHEFLAGFTFYFVVRTCVLAVYSVAQLKYYCVKFILLPVSKGVALLRFCMRLGLRIVDNWFSGKAQKKCWIHLIKLAVHITRDVVFLFIVIDRRVFAVIPEYFHHHKLFYFEMKYYTILCARFSTKRCVNAVTFAILVHNIRYGYSH